jgi:hypothetical protein
MSEEKICPYPGLRPFNDDESIFFKGRDRNIATIIELFEKKKFMMLTGASGDGKSSLIYAGVVPHARAGLFKARYNNWIVADFRPERDPLGNLTRSLGKHFRNNSEEELQKELGYGFSSLISLYKSSPYHLDQESEEWKSTDEAKRKQLKRKAANLLIMADQFEEFFTNTENYQNGIASVESQTVVNLLIETARIAHAEDIPIYIICTMRSDYIGQCAAFRGLPEYIGFSQFFVPRLKRNEILQVIEEPAQLNGDHITRRLSERLLNDITEGYDQLPILQHAVNQIWKMAANGNEEMDLLHYAKVGGLNRKELPEEDKPRFNTWFDGLPEFKKQLFAQPSLENVLNAHADELLETAYDRFAANSGSETPSISAADSRLIIKTTFQCLTKIDEARAVRNRMTVQEITDIIALPHITVKEVGRVLDIFREQGNTFIKPFITDDPSTRKTSEHTVLDITHESLIRNWDILKTWANEEYENHLNFQDFNKQLQRWVSNGKTKGFLLPIGPLTFFENWYTTCKPNKYWLARYDERDTSKEEKLTSAAETLDNANEFIRRSARKLFFTRTVMKYGANRLLTVFGLLLLVSACTYYYFDFRKKQNNYVVEDLLRKGVDLMSSDKIRPKTKANFLVNYERLFPGSAESLLDSIHNDTMAYDIARATFMVLNNYDEVVVPQATPLEHRMVVYIDSVLHVTLNSGVPDSSLAKNFGRLKDYLQGCGYIQCHSRSTAVKPMIDRGLVYLEKYIALVLKKPRSIYTENLNTAIELLLELSDMSPEKTADLLQQLSPFTDSGKENFRLLYPKDELMKVDYEHSMTYRGGYQYLSYLYAAVGNYTRLSNCLDSLIKYDPNYKNNYNQGFQNIMQCLLKYRNLPEEGWEDYFSKYLAYSGNNEVNFMQDICYQAYDNSFFSYELNPRFNNGAVTNMIQHYVPQAKYEMAWQRYYALLQKLPEDERLINVAIYFKKRGIHSARIMHDTVNANRYFDEAFEAYKKIPEELRHKDYAFYNRLRERNRSAEVISNMVAFYYPVPVNEYGWSPLQLWNNGNSSSMEYPFLKYTLDHAPGGELRDPDLGKAFEKFIYNYCVVFKFNDYSPSDLPFDYASIYGLIEVINSGPHKVNKSFVDLLTINEAFENGDTATAFRLYGELDRSKVLDESFQKMEDPGDQVNKKLLKLMAAHLALNGRLKESFVYLKALKDPWQRRNSIIDICYDLQSQGPVENTFIYLDSIYKEISKKPKFGMKLFRVLGMVGSQPIYNVGMNLFKDIDDKLKPRAINNFIHGIANDGFYYEAYTKIPEYVSRVNEMELYNEILHAEVLRKIKEMPKEDAMQKMWLLYEERAYGKGIQENYEFEGEHFDRFSE